MTEKFGRLALHMWTIDTTPLNTALDAAKQGGFDAVELRRTDFKRCFDAGMSNDQVLDLIKKSGIPVGVLGVEYGWLFATGEESKRLFTVFRESCENAVALGCKMLMSAPGQISGPIPQAIKYLKDAGDIAAEYKLKLAIEFNSQHDVLNSLAVLTELITGADKPNCGYLDRCLSFRPQRRRRPQLRTNAGRQDLLLPVQRSFAHPGNRRAAANRPPTARQRRRAMARGTRPVGGKRLHRLSQLRGAQSRRSGRAHPTTSRAKASNSLRSYCATLFRITSVEVCHGRTGTPALSRSERQDHHRYS